MQYVEPQRTVISSSQALVGFRDGWRLRFAGSPSARCVALLTAQSALESGWWKSMWNCNPSNIKAGQSWTGLYTCIRLNELIDGVYVWFSPEGEERPFKNVIKTHSVPPGHPQTRMRAFRTFAEGVADKLQFLSHARFARALRLAELGDASGYVQEIKAQRYFTAELAPYLRAVLQITDKLEPAAAQLTNAIVPITVEPIPPPDEPELCEDMARCIITQPPDWLAERLERLRAEHVEDAMAQVRRDRDRDVTSD